MRRLAIVLALTSVAACGPASDHSTSDSASAPALRAAESDTASMPMHAMPSRAIGSGTMMDEMRATLRAMQMVRPDSLRTLLPMHRQRAAAMLAQMTREIDELKAPADRQWLALMDSVHHDLARKPEMGAGELTTVMAAHRASLTRLMDLHLQIMLRKAPTN